MAFEALVKPSYQFLIPAEFAIVTPGSRQYFREKIEKMYDKTLEEISPRGDGRRREWEILKANCGVLHEWYSMSNNPGPFLLGDTVSWADFVVGGIFLWGRLVWGEESEEWKEIETWHGGQWKILLDGLVKYEKVL